MGAIRKLRMLANEIDWHVYDNGGIPYDLRKIADEMEAENAKLRGMVAVLWECCACNTDSFWCDGCDYHDVEGCKVKAQIDRMGIEAE